MCAHVASDSDTAYLVRFTGSGSDYHLVCRDCAGAPAAELVPACDACLAAREGAFVHAGFLGVPAVLERPSGLRFVHDSRDVGAPPPGDVAAIAPLEDQPRPSFLALTRAGEIVRLDLADGAAVRLHRLPRSAVDLASALAVHPSPCGRYAAIVERRGRRGVVLDLVTGATTLALDRDDYCIEHYDFAVAFARVGARTVLVHATDWNRLELADPATGRPLQARPCLPYPRGGPAPEHYLDYFHAGLTVSPDGAFVVDDGWVWHPVGIVRAWSVERWLHEYAWESEDGPSVQALAERTYFWDAPRCFVGPHTVALYGYGPDSDAMLDAVQLWDVERGERLAWFAGVPQGTLAWDGEHLVAVAERGGTSLWDVAAGARVHVDPTFTPTAFHARSGRFITLEGGGRVRESRTHGV